MHLKLIRRVNSWTRIFTRFLRTIIDIHFSKSLNFDISILSNKKRLQNIERTKIYEIDLKEWRSLNSNIFNTDPISGITLDSKHFSPILKPRKIESFDIRVVWEISRFQFPPSMNNKKEELEKYINLFRTKNPIFFGPNWVSPMEVGIRAINILITCINNKHQSKVTSRFLNDSFYFLINNLENHNYYKGNHYLINLCSLMILISKSNYSNEDKINYLINELEYEIRLQFNNDGSYYENSTYYHFFVTEALCQTLYFVKNECSNPILNKVIQKNKKLQENQTIINILGKALHFSFSINYKNQIFPIIGDEDSGRFIYTSEKVNNLGQEFYKIIPNQTNNENDFKNIPILKKKNPLKTTNHYPLIIEEVNICHFEDFGLLVVSTVEFFLTLRTKYCHKKMVHAHEDLGSINLIVNDKINLWDPGTYTYNRDINERNYFRSGKNHNIGRAYSSVENLKSPFTFKSNEKTTFSIQENIYSVVIDFKLEVEKEVIKRRILFQSDGIYIICEPEEELKFPIKLSNKYGKIENSAYSRSIYSL